MFGRRSSLGRPSDVNTARAVPVTTPPEDRSPVAVAYQWASRIMVVAMEMVLPGLAGHWLDVQLGTVVLFLLIGLGLGCTAAIVHLVQMTRSEKGPKSSHRAEL